MIKSRKMILGTLGTMAIVAAPIAAVVSCGTTKSKEIEISALDKALMAVSKPQTINEYKASLIKSITDNFSKDDKKTEFDSTKDFKAINEAKTKEEMFEAASKMTVWTKAKEAVNTVITIDGVDYDLKTFDMMAATTFTVKTIGSAKTEKAAEILATKANKEALNKKIDKAETKKDIKDIFTKFSGNRTNTEKVDTSTIDAIQVEGKDKAIKQLKAAAKKLAATVFNKDYKTATEAAEEVKTIVTVGSTEVPLNNFVKDPKSKFKVKTTGRSEVTVMKVQVTPIKIVTVDTYKEALIKVIKEFKDGDSTPFENADISKISTAKTVSEALAAAKAIKAPTTDKKDEVKKEVKIKPETTEKTKGAKEPKVEKEVKGKTEAAKNAEADKADIK